MMHALQKRSATTWISSLLKYMLVSVVMAGLFLVGYGYGQHRAERKCRLLSVGTFIASFAALQDIQEGSITQAVDRLKALCASRAKIVESDAHLRKHPGIAPLLNSFRNHINNETVGLKSAEQKTTLQSTEKAAVVNNEYLKYCKQAWR